MKYQTLENVSLSCIHKTFLEAFSDYQVSMEMSEEQLGNLLKRRGFDPAFSVGAFEDDKLVGFVFNGLRGWDGEKTIYDMGTGVIPDFRQMKITSTLLQMVKDICKEKGVRWYLLEVIKENDKALSLYEKQGFEVLRTFDCYQAETKNLNLETCGEWELQYPTQFDAEQWEKLCSFWTYQPSWQNSMDSVNAVSDDFLYTLAVENGKIIGYGIGEKEKGDIVQIAVAKEYRRKGVACAIVSDLIKRSGAEKLRALNIDSRDKELGAFLEDIGFQIYIAQYEMKKYLD